MSTDPRQPDVLRHAAELLQSFYDETLTEPEALELLDLWAASPQAELEARDSFIMESVFRFAEDSRSRLSPDRLKRLRAAFQTRRGLAVDEPGPREPDFDELTRLAAESPALPKKPVEKPRPAQKVPAPKPREPQKAGWSIPLSVLAPMLLALFAVVVYFEWTGPKENGSGFGEPALHDAVAVVTNLADVRWAPGQKIPEPGKPLLSGALRFDAGTVELLFYNGVRSIVEGPAELTLLDAKQVFCRKGDWSVSVPPQGTGFEIQTPQGNVRDLGTRFFASIGDRHCDVHVVEGVVELNKPDVEPVLLRENHGVRFGIADSVGKTVADILFDAGRFVDKLEWRRRRDLVRPAPTATADLKTAIGNVDFSADTDLRTLSDATAFGGVLIEGSRPETKAFHFDDRQARLRLKPFTLKPREGPAALTAAVKLRVDRLDGDGNPILMSEGLKRGGIAWLVSRTGSLLFGVRARSGVSMSYFETPVVLTPDMLGQWVWLFLRVDTARKEISVYLNDEPVFYQKAASLTPLDLSAVDVGNWVPNLRPLNGAVQRVLLFDRVVSHDEIQGIQADETAHK